MMSLTKKELFTYCPPPFAEGWNELATQPAGRLVTDYRGMVNSGEELYDCYGEEIAQKWIEIDVLRAEMMPSGRDGRDVPCVVVGTWITGDEAGL